MKKFLTLIAVAAMAFAAQATECTAADGTATGEFAPVYGFNYETDQHNQMQYPAAELAGLAAGTEITGMKFYTSTPETVNALGGTVTVSLANLDETTPWSVDGFGYISGNLLDVDVTAVATVTPAADEDGVWTITFDAPFTYTGDALLIDIQTVAGGYEDTEFYGKEMGAYLAMTTYGYAGTKKGQTILPKATFIYEGGEEPANTVTTLSEANALEDDAEFAFNGDAVVTLFKNGYLFLRDESGYAQISGVTGEFANGQVLSEGWSATTTTITDPWVRYINAAGLSASGETNDELKAAQKLTCAVDESMLNAFVYVENVTITSGMMPGLPMRALPLPDGTSIGVTSTLWGMSWPANGSKNIYGVICKVDGELKINVCDFVTYEEPSTFMRGDVNKDGKVSIADVTALINYLLSGDASAIDLQAADCDEDGNIKINDVTALINYLLSGSW